MGLFGGQTKTETQVSPSIIINKEEKQKEDSFSLPKAGDGTVIATGVTVVGTICGEGMIQIDGRVEGEISIDGSVIVTSTGIIQGPITADVVRVSGHVTGDITTHSHVKLEKTGNVEGDITTPSLVIEDGGQLNGRSTMVKIDNEPVSAQPSGNHWGELQFGSNYYKIEEEDVDEEAEADEEA